MILRFAFLGLFVFAISSCSGDSPTGGNPNPPTPEPWDPQFTRNYQVEYTFSRTVWPLEADSALYESLIEVDVGLIPSWDGFLRSLDLRPDSIVIEQSGASPWVLNPDGSIEVAGDTTDLAWVVDGNETRITGLGELSAGQPCDPSSHEVVPIGFAEETLMLADRPVFACPWPPEIRDLAVVGDSFYVKGHIVYSGVFSHSTE